MTKLTDADIQKMEVKILMLEDMLDNYINSKTKLTWAEINNIELNKLENIIDNIRAQYLIMEAEKQKKANTTAPKPADIIDPDIIEKALYNSKIETETQKPENKPGDEDQKIDFEFHEQFFS